MQVVPNGAHHDLAGVQADAHAQLQAAGAAYLLGVGLHGRLHGQGGVAGAQGVILMGDGRAKQGHDAIAQHLVHRALEAVHGVHHAAQGGVQELLGGFRVEIPDQFGGVFEVGEQHRDLLALAFQSAAGGEDFLREIHRGVGERGTRGVPAGALAKSQAPRPDEDFAILIDGQALGIDDFVLEAVQGVLIEIEPDLSAR